MRRFKRILCMILICITVMTTCYQPMEVKAAAIPLTDPVALEELYVLISSLYETVLIASGASDGLNNYDKITDFWDALDVVRGFLGMPQTAEIQVLMDDGSVQSVRFDDFKTITDGTGALVIPDEGTFAKYRLLDGGGSGDENGDDNGNKFSKIKGIMVANVVVSAMAAYVKSKFEGEEKNYYYPELESGYPTYYWDGTYTSNNNYIVLDGNARTNQSNDTFCLAEFSKNNINVDYKPFAFVYQGSNSTWYLELRYFYGTNIYSLQTDIIQYGYEKGVMKDSLCWKRSSTTYSHGKGFSYVNLNIPLFNSAEEAKNYFLNNDNSGLLNGLCYDFPGLADTAPETLAPIPNKWLDPDATVRMNHLLVDTAANNQPVPDEDPAVNNNTYKQLVNDAVVENLPELDPEVAPSDPGDTGGTETPGDSSMEGESNQELKYVVDLTEIFPFCLPFDLMRFLDALNAEPEAPNFVIPFIVEPLNIDMEIPIDLSFLDDVMKIFRLGITGLFIIGLIKLTSAIIKW